MLFFVTFSKSFAIVLFTFFFLLFFLKNNMVLIFFMDEFFGDFSKNIYYLHPDNKRNPKIFERVGKKIIQ